MTEGLINACNKKNNLYKKFIKNKNDINEQRYKKYKNKFISVLRMSKQEYYTKSSINIRITLRKHGIY